MATAIYDQKAKFNGGSVTTYVDVTLAYIERMRNDDRYELIGEPIKKTFSQEELTAAVESCGTCD